MNRPIAFLLCLLTLTAGCTTPRPPLAEAEGPYRALNPGRWEPTADDLRGGRPTQAAASDSRARQP